MQVDVIELVEHLLPDMVEQISPLISRTIIEVSLKVEVLAALLVEVHFLDTPLGSEVEFLEILIGNKFGTCIQRSAPASNEAV